MLWFRIIMNCIVWELTLRYKVDLKQVHVTLVHVVHVHWTSDNQNN